MRAIALGAASAFTAVLSGAAPTVAGVELESHRAAYRLSLAETTGASGISTVRGALVLESQRDCSGWLSNQRLGFVAETDEGPGVSFDVRFTSWESADRTRLRFSVRSFDDGELTEEFKGTAELTAPGAGGEVRYTLPDGDAVDLPTGTIFPTDHIVRLIEAARAGERLVDHRVFDGSGPDALNKVTAFIGDPSEAEGEGARTWPVSLAYYGQGAADELPEFEISFRLAENGVLRDLLLDYGDFALRGSLAEMTALEEPHCP